MAALPVLTLNQIEEAVPGVKDVDHLGKGGQKVVFKGKIGDSWYALKFILCPDLSELDSDDDDEPRDDPAVIIRAKREVETMRDCQSPYMVKLGPIGLEFTVIDGQSVAFYTEELIEGTDLLKYQKGGKILSPKEIIELGLNITNAIEGLWKLKKVHRDIKPGNIMARSSGGFVLLDAGLAFDVVGESISGGFTVGTKRYFSPEQFDYLNRRIGLDCRSDMFALGVTLYELACGVHPFFSRGITSEQFYLNVTEAKPTPLPEHVPGFPEALDDVIQRALGKSPHLRYRTCEQLTNALKEVEAII